MGEVADHHWGRTIVESDTILFGRLTLRLASIRFT